MLEDFISILDNFNLNNLYIIPIIESSKFIYKDILEINKDEYKGILFNYIIMYEKSKKFEDIYNYITTTYFILKIDNVEIDIGYEDESIREFLKWVIDEINK